MSLYESIVAFKPESGKEYICSPFVPTKSAAIALLNMCSAYCMSFDVNTANTDHVKTVKQCVPTEKTLRDKTNKVPAEIITQRKNCIEKLDCMELACGLIQTVQNLPCRKMDFNTDRNKCMQELSPSLAGFPEDRRLEFMHWVAGWCMYSLSSWAVANLHFSLVTTIKDSDMESFKATYTPELYRENFTQQQVVAEQLANLNVTPDA